MYFLFPKLALLRPKKNYDILDSFGAIIQLRPEQLSFCLTPKSVLPTEYSRNPPPKTHLEEVGVPEGGGEAEDVVPLGVLRDGLHGKKDVCPETRIWQLNVYTLCAVGQQKVQLHEIRADTSKMQGDK